MAVLTVRLRESRAEEWIAGSIVTRVPPRRRRRRVATFATGAALALVLAGIVGSARIGTSQTGRLDAERALVARVNAPSLEQFKQTRYASAYGAPAKSAPIGGIPRDSRLG